LPNRSREAPAKSRTRQPQPAQPISAGRTTLESEPPPPDLVPRCETAGILGAVAGVLGTLQAVEVIKELLQLGDSLDGALLLYDALRARFHAIRIAKDAECPTCSQQV
jgi:adenylyltransferase/sulfurtransferase